MALSNLGFVPGNKTAYEVPQYRANHALNAAGGVEPIRVLDIEWALSCELSTPDGLAGPCAAFGHLLESIGAAYESESGLACYPVSVAAEMRLFRGSDVLVSPVTALHGCSAPEVISHSENRGWPAFYQRMHRDMVNLFGTSSDLKCHLAKMGWELPGFLAWTRQQYRAEATPSRLDTFARICQDVDPRGMFRNPFLTQFLFSENPDYNPPTNLPMDADGKVGNPPREEMDDDQPDDVEPDAKRGKFVEEEA
jgi:hypothetical protein